MSVMNFRPGFTHECSRVVTNISSTLRTPRDEGIDLSSRQTPSHSPTEALDFCGDQIPVQGSAFQAPTPAPVHPPEVACKNVYRGSHRRESPVWIRVPRNSFLGLFATGLLFLALPFFHFISTSGKMGPDLASIDFSRTPPPAPPEEAPPPVEEEKELERPELRKVQSKLTLSQLELALSPGMGDASLGGDFQIEFEVNAMDELEAVFEISEVDRIPRAIHQISPVYPPDLKRNKVSGIVTLLFVCTYKGGVNSIQVRSSPNVLFEESAVRALRKWKFKPGMKDGKKVNVRMLVPFHFGNPN